MFDGREAGNKQSKEAEKLGKLNYREWSVKGERYENNAKNKCGRFFLVMDFNVMDFNGL